MLERKLDQNQTGKKYNQRQGMGTHIAQFP